MSNFSADQMLDLVKDSGKFEKRLKELAKQEASAKAAMDKSRQMNIDVSKDVDKKRAEVETLKAEYRQQIEQGTKPLDALKAELSKREAAVVADEKLLGKQLEKIKADQNAIKISTAAVKQREVDFEARVNAFEMATKRLAENA